MYGEITKTLAQIRTCAATADRAALMVDGHLGYAVPIGGVVAYKDAISPSGVGVDIAAVTRCCSSRYDGRRAAGPDRPMFSGSGVAAAKF